MSFTSSPPSGRTASPWSDVSCTGITAPLHNIDHCGTSYHDGQHDKHVTNMMAERFQKVLTLIPSDGCHAAKTKVQ